MRTKIIAGNLIAVLVVGLVSYVMVTGQIERTFLAEVDETIVADYTLFEQQWRLSSYEFLEQSAQQAALSDTQDIFTALDEERQRTRAFERANAVADWFGRRNRTRGGPPEVVAVTDDRGVVIARNQDRNRMHDLDLTRQLRTLSGVLSSGEPRADVWRFEAGQNKLLQAALAPIRDQQGRVIGALIVGYDMSNGMAARAGSVLGREVVILVDDEVYSSSLGGESMQGLSQQLFGEALRASTTAALAEGGATSERYFAQVGEVQYVGVTGPLPLSDSAAVGYAVLGSRTGQLEKASATSTILVMTGIGILIVLLYSFFISSLFIKPVAEMEEGVLAVINGRTDLRLDIQSAELGGLAYRINQLLNVFTGTPEEDEDGRVSSPPEAWAAEADQGLDDSRPAAPAAAPGGGDTEEEDPALAAELEAEPEAAYYARIYREYVAAKEALGENVSNITEDRFVKRLQANEGSLLKKHGCRMVRFQVQTRGTQVNLRPIIIR